MEPVGDMSTMAMVKEFLSIAFPAMIGNVVFMGQDIINLRFAAQFDDPTVIAGIGLGGMTETIVCQAILMKMNRAMESLVPQAFGRGELDLCGVYLNRGRLMILIASLPIMAAILHAKYLYLALH